MDFFRTEKYDKDFLKPNMMGPNSMMILEELLEKVPLKPGMRVLDLGCGNGLTSVFLAKEYGVQVFALDLWISATDNYRRFREAGVEQAVIPIHADAMDMPFADEFFDAVISVDAYHYVGNNDTFFPEKIRPLLKQNGIAAIAFPGMKYEVKENIPDEAVLFVGNHRSYFDILLTYSRCRRLTGYIAKKEMERYLTLTSWMRRVYCLFLDRKDPKEGLKTILQAIDYIKNGISICVFPEGTRNEGEELSMLPFKDGAFKISTKTGCPIVPISLNNTAEIFEKHMPRIKKTHVVIEYGKPIYPDQLDKDTKRHIGDYVENIIRETIHKNADLV